MYMTNLRKVGGSVMLAVPPALLDLLNLSAGTKVGLAVDGGRLVVEAQAAPRYSLAELLAQFDPTAELSEADRDWVTGAAIGNELL